MNHHTPTYFEHPTLTQKTLVIQVSFTWRALVDAVGAEVRRCCLVKMHIKMPPQGSGAARLHLPCQKPFGAFVKKTARSPTRGDRAGQSIRQLMSRWTIESAVSCWCWATTPKCLLMRSDMLRAARMNACRFEAMTTVRMRRPRSCPDWNASYLMKLIEASAAVRSRSRRIGSMSSENALSNQTPIVASTTRPFIPFGQYTTQATVSAATDCA